MKLDGYRARQNLVGLSAHCVNSYILQHIRIMHVLYVQYMQDAGICTVYTQFN